jgi:hypothetical protein
MKQIVCLIILIFAFSELSYAGIDESILWRYELSSGPADQFGFNPSFICGKGMGLMVLHSNPYQLNHLNWDFGSIKYGLGRIGFIGCFRSFRLSELYDNNTVSSGGAVMLNNHFGTSLMVNISTTKFGNFGNYSGSSLNVNLMYSVRDIMAIAGLKNITLKKPYSFPDIEKPEPYIIAKMSFGNGVQLLGGFRHLRTDINKWYFRQDIALSKGVGLSLGYMNNPNLLEWGLDLYWKNATLLFTYQAISKLNDTMILGLSFGT